ncbi:MAG: hypothetical protein EBX37_18245 [Alphaproteobacteria bacterium]|nr:hypothetical protein [Alphaproteobacteria bacterium]
MKLLPLSTNPETLAHWSSHPLAMLIGMPFPLAREFWLAVADDGSVLGQIGASLSLHHPGTGYLGFYSLRNPSDEKVSGLLIEEACRFLEQAGATRAIGPMHLNTWLPYRFALPMSEPGSFIWEPKNPPEDPVLWKKNGFTREMLYASQGHDGLAHFVAAMKPSWEKVKKIGFSFRSVSAERLLEEELPILHRLSMSGFADNHLFEPLPEKLFRELYVPLAGKNARQNLALAAFVLSPEGREVGFSFSFIDPSHGKPRVVLKTATILPEFRGKGLSNALFYETLGSLRRCLGKPTGFIPSS